MAHPKKLVNQMVASLDFQRLLFLIAISERLTRRLNSVPYKLADPLDPMFSGCMWHNRRVDRGECPISDAVRWCMIFVRSIVVERLPLPVDHLVGPHSLPRTAPSGSSWFDYVTPPCETSDSL